jgi:chromosome partitioning protein
LLRSLQLRIEPFPIPKIGVFMNRAKKPGGTSTKRFSNETQRYLDDADDVLEHVSAELGLKVRLFDTAIFDRVGIKRAIQEGMPKDIRGQFEGVWNEVKAFVQEK